MNLDTVARSTPHRRALLAGASGVVGAGILRGLLADPGLSEVHVLSRRALSLGHPKLVLHCVDFAHLPVLPRVDEVYLALGTTLKLAGSQAAFRAVDFHMNWAVAQAAVTAGARRAGVVSAVGADAKSVAFYSRVKGELEDALKAMAWEALVIAQPSLLLDDRRQLAQPSRIGETLTIPLAKRLGPLLPKRYRPVYGQQVASALVRAVPAAVGVTVLSSDVLANEPAPRAARA